MAKAQIEMSSGTKITVEGTADEVAAVVAHVKDRERGLDKTQSIEKKHRTPTSSSNSLVSLILDLKAGGFFNEPRKVIDVTNALAQRAQHYPEPSVSTSLIRHVKKGVLGRVKEGKTWKYVNR